MIYLDNAATTYMYSEVIEAMWPYYSKEFYNPSAGYSDSKKVRNKIEQCRQEIATWIGALPEEIFFTSGGTESDNWVCTDARKRHVHVITTTIEHKAVLNPLREYQRMGGKVTFAPVNSKGVVSPETIKKAITGNTGLISVIMANNEIGTIEPIERIGHIAKEYGILFHSDAVQAFGHIPINVNEMNLDMMSASSHKFHGPKGVGFLYVRKDTRMKPMILGGSQEYNMRAGTENVPGIVGMTTAAGISCRNINKTMKYLTEIRNYVIDKLKRKIPEIIINGSVDSRLPNNINFSLKNVDAQSVLVLMDMRGICASAGSACNTMNMEPSHVMKAIGISSEYVNGTIRISMDETFNMRKADYVINVISQIVRDLKE